MEFSKTTWTEKDYLDFLSYLNSLSDSTYCAFQKKLIQTEKPMIGLRTPVLKSLAKEIAKGNYREYMQVQKDSTYEEVLIHGFILGYLKIPFEELLEELKKFLPLIDNWATNDMVCANLKAFKKNKERGLKEIQVYCKSKNPYEIRFGLVLLLDHYVEEKYLNTIFELVEKVSSEEYYVKMAVAWLLSVCYIKEREKTYAFLKKNTLEEWIHNKSIQKIKESLRVSKEEKETLNLLKRASTGKNKKRKEEKNETKSIFCKRNLYRKSI